MVNGWVKRTNGQIDELYESPVAIIAEWHDEQQGEVTLYADGVVECEGPFPVELLAYVLVEWHGHLRTEAVSAVVG
jgi:hypothetical protein